VTPTPAELALWRALNREPEFVPTFGMGNNGGPEWRRWNIEWAKFCNLSEYGRVVYFEGKVREDYPCMTLQQFEEGDWQCCRAKSDNAILCSGPASDFVEAWGKDELDARFHAACRALAALGVIDDYLVKEISDA
jgi:hypothetical protein